MKSLRYKFWKASKIISINIGIATGILIVPEITLSKYFLSSAALKVPEALVNHSEIFDVSIIENTRNNIRAKYSRDSNGYRPYKTLVSGREAILTIGGSTTDQRYIDNKKTWQAVMEKNSNLSVINGGVDGQSSYGHLVAIKKWHSQVLPINQIKKIIFYIGVNDVRFSKSLETAKGNVYDSPTTLRRIRGFFSRRSFFYKKLKQAKFKLDLIRGGESISPDGFNIAGHDIKNPDFLKKPIESNINLSSNRESSAYRKLFKNLIISTKKIFSKSKIYIVQQQDPKCLITNNKVYARTNQNGIKNYCSSLASIYKAQSQALSNLNINNVIIIKMYEENPIPDNGFYDGLHTNTLGSKMIGKYLLNKLNENF